MTAINVYIHRDTERHSVLEKVMFRFVREDGGDLLVGGTVRPRADKEFLTNSTVEERLQDNEVAYNVTYRQAICDFIVESNKNKYEFNIVSYPE